MPALPSDPSCSCTRSADGSIVAEDPACHARVLQAAADAQAHRVHLMGLALLEQERVDDYVDREFTDLFDRLEARSQNTFTTRTQIARSIRTRYGQGTLDAWIQHTEGARS